MLGTIAIGPVMTGTARPFRGEETSAIAKAAVQGPVHLGPLGLDGDEQADLVHHGGVDQALHHYPHDHYAFWRSEIGDHHLLDAPGGFGENISTSGLTEGDLLIGDRLQLGGALVEVTQGRQPCWKIDHRFACKGMMKRIIETARCGWYYRVVEPGMVAAGDTLELVERGEEGWSVEHAFRLLLPGNAARDGAEIAALAQLPALGRGWRARALKLLGQ